MSDSFYLIVVKYTFSGVYIVVIWAEKVVNSQRVPRGRDERKKERILGVAVFSKVT